MSEEKLSYGVADQIKEAYKNLESVLKTELPDGRNKAIALTNLEQSMLWALNYER